ncbi:DNA-directed RNA polymerase [Colletotrichum spinosum]|uniref:DNA-directed RNA polymerase n=1 Tax=Colletotrichum spinosum TaxID=1347390 RepID=A0A4R8Q494_9PEZI|nr:DNA-directed RNA polymerase [Colletotrichum spinosum]
MLLRHTRKSLSLHHAAVFRPLRPTLRCPSVLTLTSAHRPGRLFSTQDDARPVTRRKSFDASGRFGTGRSLATAVDDYKPIDNSNFAQLADSGLSTYHNGAVRTEPRPLATYDPTSPLVLQDDEIHIPRMRTLNNGITGDIQEMLAVFDACIRVHKLERAEKVIKRLSEVEAFPRENVILLNNRYLRASLDKLRLQPDATQVEALHTWYEINIRKKDLPQTAETVACMVKASLLIEKDSRWQHRLIRRYMDMVPGEAGLEVLSMSDILDDQDLTVVTTIYPNYDFAPTPEEVADDTTLSAITAPASPEQLLHPTPEVLATPQKGSGLRTLKQTLSLFNEIPQHCDVSHLSLRERREIQARLERDCIDSAIERWREDNESLQNMGMSRIINHGSFSSRLHDWHQELEARLKDEMAKIDAAEAATKKTQDDYDRCLYGPFLRLSTPSRLAALTIIHTLSAVTSVGADRGISLATAVTGLAKTAEDDARAFIMANEKRTDKNTKPSRRVKLSSAEGPQFTLESTESRKVVKPLVKEDKAKESTMANVSWPPAVRGKVGAALLAAFIESAKISKIREDPVTKTLFSQSQPAFAHTTQLKRGKQVGMILLNKELVSVLSREPPGDFLAKHLPMLVPPAPWKSFDKGGFLESKTSLVRVKQGDKDQRLYTEAAIARGDMDQVLKGLDVLGKTAWRVNTPVLNVMLEAWNSGERLANMPPLNPQIPLPDEPEPSDDPSERRAWIKAVKAVENEKGSLHSQRCYMNFQLEIARAFRNQTFYFPHNIDFRGRAYPIPTYLNHMGADNVRGLLRFANGKQLGERGLKWLKVHLANVFGFDKASLEDRASFASDNLVNIFDSANNPLGGNRWWLQAEDPWQCLATCFELKAAFELPDPTKYVSHLPVHQDGTCNGLQHYAALGGDAWGARQVNLEPGAKPADVYSAVADIVKEGIAKDVKAGNAMAIALTGKITRKVVKQTVMTNVYGVTFSGARKQVCRQLDALYPELPKESGQDNIVLASYIARLIFQALGSMFRGAHDIQFWLGEIGGRVCRALSPEQMSRIANEGVNNPQGRKKAAASSANTYKTSTQALLAEMRSTIVWTTPMRMPVAQPYRRSGTRIIRTSLQQLSLTVPERSDPVNRRKQLQAFPPNFIHSLDATHMLLSALECHDLGLDFAAVHDSFWTHAADIDDMNRVLRNAFIRIHEEDVVGRLAAEFQARYRNSLHLATLKPGTKVVKAIKEWRQTQSRNKTSTAEELLLEYERQKLLKSDDAKEVARGKAMVTPASLFAEMATVDAIAEEDGLDTVGLGNIAEDPGEDVLAGEEGDEAVSSHADEEDVSALDDDGEESSHAKAALEATKMCHFESVISPAAKRGRPVKNPVSVWLPFMLPEIPKKGDFDVRRLKDSEYFFS